jgi:hypothetical protein
MEVEELCCYGKKDKEGMRWFLHSFFLLLLIDGFYILKS